MENDRQSRRLRSVEFSSKMKEVLKHIFMVTTHEPFLEFEGGEMLTPIRSPACRRISGIESKIQHRIVSVSRGLPFENLQTRRKDPVAFGIRVLGFPCASARTLAWVVVFFDYRGRPNHTTRTHTHAHINIMARVRTKGGSSRTPVNELLLFFLFFHAPSI